MGMTTHIATKTPANWQAIVASLKAQGIDVQMRLIDGQLAFPDEQPAEHWRELRVASSGRMVTIARKEAGIDLVCWGNADEMALKFRDALAGAFSQTATNTTDQDQGD